jgi:hypothetical protein
MRNLGIILSMVLLAACASETVTPGPQDTGTPTDTNTSTDTNTPTDTTPACSADCNGALPNNPQGLCSVYDVKYASGSVTCTAACTVDASSCVEAVVNTPGEFQPCTTDCAEGLQCAQWTPQEKYCLRPCNGEDDTTTCGANSCEGVGDSNNDGVIDLFLCLKKDAKRNGACFDNLSVCAEGEGTCQWTDLENSPQGPVPTEFRCKLDCDDIGVQGTCPANEQCLENSAGKVETQVAADQPVACTDDAGCDAGYSCLALTTGSYCARFVGWCGNASLVCGEAMTEEGIGVCAAAPENDCSPSGNGLCTIVGATGPAADALCIAIQGEKSICLGFCGGLDDEETLDCGTGYQCTRADDPGLLIPQTQKDASGNPLTCVDDTACDAAKSYKCVTTQDGADVCGRAWKMCQTL